MDGSRGKEFFAATEQAVRGIILRGGLARKAGWRGKGLYAANDGRGAQGKSKGDRPREIRRGAAGAAAARSWGSSKTNR